MTPEERIDRGLEGLLTDAEWQQLQRDILADASLRQSYVERAALHGQLRASASVLQPEVSTPNPRRVWPIIAWSAAAACVTLVVSQWWAQPSFVATLTEAEHCRWAASDLPTRVGSSLTAGTLSLTEGMATLTFRSGATITIEAPTQLEVSDAMHCRLIEGSLVANVPEPAHGFTVVTPDLKVIDLGTRFGLTTAAISGNSQVRVFEGEIELSRHGDPKLQRLTEGKSLNLTASTPPDLELARPAAPSPQDDGWSTLPTSFGRGKDAFIRRGDIGHPSGHDPQIMVKHTDIEKGRNNERRAYLTFDLEDALIRDSNEMQLQLTPVPSGLGFSALVPESRFAVYALTDETLDAWDEASLTWSSAPAQLDAGLDPAKVTRIAEFSLPRGGIVGAITVTSPLLKEAVQHDGNGLLTLIVVRETGETDTSGLVHAFATKEHPASKPPTLRFR